MSLLGLKELDCVNKMSFIVVYSRNNMLLTMKFVIFCVL